MVGQQMLLGRPHHQEAELERNGEGGKTHLSFLV